jgi:hypothetical protein
VEPQPATEYGIRLTASGCWLGQRNHYTQVAAEALRFEHSTTAFGMALEWYGLEPREFTVEPLEGRK